MTARSELLIWCDGCQKVERFQPNQLGVLVARKELKEKGWSYKGRLDYCPDCTKKKKWKR